MTYRKKQTDTRSLHIVAVEYAFSRHNVLNDYSHSANVIGDVQKIRINLSRFQRIEFTVTFCQGLSCTKGRVLIEPR